METITKRDDYLRLLVRIVPKALLNGNREAEQALIRFAMECFDQGIELAQNGSIEIQL